MKEATGELSTTVIAIVAIAAILAVFTVILLPMIRTQITLTQACTSGPGYVSYYDKDATTGTQKKQVDCSGKATANSWTCTYYDTNEKVVGTKSCSKK